MNLTHGASVESEVKFVVSEDCLKRIKSKRTWKSGHSGKAISQNLRSVYFDSPNFDLKNSGMSLRVRTVSKKRVQTLKSGTAVVGGLSSPLEIETEISGEIPDLNAIYDAKLRKQVKKILKNKPLNAVFETKIQRTIRNFVSNKGDEVEIAFDSGEVTTTNGSKPLIELELELKKGRPVTLFEVAKELLENEVWRFSTQNKSSHGYAMLCGQPSLTGARAASNRSNLQKNDTIELAIYSIFRNCYDQIAQNTNYLIESDDPLGPHQFRVSIRRLRSAFSCFRGILDCESLRSVNENLKIFASEVGRLRDLDVFIYETIPKVKEHAPNHIDIDSLVVSAQKRRTTIKNETVSLLDSPKFRDFLLTVGMEIEARKWINSDSLTQNQLCKSNIMELSRQLLDKRWSKLNKESKRIDSLSIEERHELRKKIKKFRYAIEFFLPLYDSMESTLFLKSIKKMQNKLGYLNDIAMTECLFDDMNKHVEHNSDINLAMGFVLGWHSAKSAANWDVISDHWNSVSSMKPFWT